MQASRFRTPLFPCGVGTVVANVVSTVAFRGLFPSLGSLKETKIFLPHPLVKTQYCGGLRDREVAYSTSDRQGSNFESCVWKAVSSHSSHHPQEVLLAQLSLYVHKSVGFSENQQCFSFLNVTRRSR